MSKRKTISTVLALVLVGVVIAVLANSRAGLPAWGVDDVADQDGPTTGKPCPVDQQYVDKEPTGLRPEAATAWEQTRAEAAKQSVTLCLFDGKRSARQQQAEFDAAVRRYGSVEEGGKWALPPEKSMHVKGLAVDVQPRESAAWLERSAGSYGWCRRYDNEYWHFEYDANYAKSGCPPMAPSALP